MLSNIIYRPSLTHGTMNYVPIQVTNTHHRAYKLCRPPFTSIKNAALMFVVLPWGGNTEI